mmetsp:Transcript_36745/g.57445  ORF Transcript_36745/g.57445 Transcript_36745/m.57445 type:complete len:101 (+) Transcript_36745:379-681(+)
MAFETGISTRRFPISTGEHYQFSHSLRFQEDEMVVVCRSDGSKKFARIHTVFQGQDEVYDLLLSASGSVKLKVGSHKIGKITEKGEEYLKPVKLPPGEVV